jgi:hypothetical protein
MRTRKEIFKGLLFISLFMTFIYLCIPSSNYTQCQLTEQFYDLEFEGIVENVQKPMKLTTSDRFKLTTFDRLKLTSVNRLKLTT